MESGSETRLLTHSLCLPSLWEQSNGPCGQQTREGEGLGSLEISGYKSGPHGGELGHYLKGTVGEQDQMGITHNLWLCTYNSQFNHVKRKKNTLLLSSSNLSPVLKMDADKTDTRELFASPVE